LIVVWHRESVKVVAVFEALDPECDLLVGGRDQGSQGADGRAVGDEAS